MTESKKTSVSQGTNINSDFKLVDNFIFICGSAIAHYDNFLLFFLLHYELSSGLERWGEKAGDVVGISKRFALLISFLQ